MLCLLRQQPFFKEVWSAYALQQRGWPDLLSKKLNKIKTAFPLESAPDIWTLHQRILLNHLNYYQITENSKVPEEDAMQLMKGLDDFYLAAKIKYGAELLNRKLLYQEPFEIMFWEDVKSLVIQQIQANEALPLHEGYYLMLQLLQSPTPQHYEQLKSFLLNNSTTIAPKEQTEWLVALLNFNARTIRNGDLSATREIFSLYHYAWVHKLLATDGFVSPTRFTNIIDVACKLGEFEWVETFLLSIDDLVEPKYIETAKNLSSALISFEKKQFKKSQQLLQEVTYINNYYTLRARLLLLCAFYDADEDPAVLDDNIRSFSAQVKRNKKLDPDLKLGCLHFCKMLNEIRTQNKFSKQKLLEKIETYRPIVYKTWLLRKIMEK